MKVKVLLFLFFVTMLTSLWQNNIYILFLFSLATCFLLPFHKWWDGISLSLLFFSLFYCLMQYINDGIGSGFVFISTLITPVSFYRFGRWIIEWIDSDRKRLWFLFFSFFCFLLPVLLLTIQDMMLVGFVNESRTMLSDIGKEDSTLAATLYGLMSSTGIGFISLLFAKSLNYKQKIIFLSVFVISMLVVLHLVNRTGVFLFIFCILFSVIYSTKMNPLKIIPIVLLLLVIIFLVTELGLIDQEILDAYAQRETSATANVAEFGGRSDRWADAISNLFSSLFGWERKSYAHNLWLDLAAVGGWFALFPFLVASLKTFVNMKKVMKKQVTPFRLVLLSTFVSMFFNSMVEPVIEGSLLFLGLFLMIWGMLKSITLELR